MARRRGKIGEWLSTDDWTGFTTYSSQLHKDYWGSLTKKPLKRNLQEIATPLSDPRPVDFFRGPNYETYPTECIGGAAPLFVGNTNVPTNQNNAAFQAMNLHPGVGSQEVGCTLLVY